MTSKSRDSQENFDFVPLSAGEPFLDESKASIPLSSRNGVTDSAITTRRISIHFSPKKFKYANLDNMCTAFSKDGDFLSVRYAVELCRKAYANVSIFRNTVDILAELSNSKIYLKGGSAKSRKFIEAWLKKIGIYNFTKQYFKERFLSGNIFIYRIDASFNDSEFKKLIKSFGAKKNKIPYRYIVLNPSDVLARDVTSFSDNVYVKAISKYEAERLKNPKTENDRLVYDGLPEDVKKRIQDNGYTNSLPIELPLDPDKIYTSFYKKQDYEPFAVPFGFPVLDDINLKLEYKKIDQAICRTVENVILLITQGDEKHGPNKIALEKLQAMFENQAISRVLVSDFTTKMDFIVPDLKKVLGKEKYEIVDKDIKEGLMNIVGGSDEKFANQSSKFALIMERVVEGQEEFLEIIQPEIEKVCESMGLKQVPTAAFTKSNLKDSNAQMVKVISRFVELGIFTPQDAFKAFDEGTFPEMEDLLENQKAFKDYKDSGLFVPINYNGSNSEEEPHSASSQSGRPEGTTGPKQTTDKKSPIGKGLQSKASLKNFVETYKEVNHVYNLASSLFKRKYGVKSINEKCEAALNDICEKIIIRYQKESWSNVLTNCINEPKKIKEMDSVEISKDIVNLSSELGLDYFASAIIHNSQNPI
jgi:hypothetical protein